MEVQIGDSPSRYLRKVHIGRAKEILTDTGIPVTEIAVMAGSMSPQ